MLRAMYNGTSGMGAAQKALSTISNDIANSNTVGFKQQRTQFGEVFFQQLKSPSAPGQNLAGTNPIDIGNGVQVTAIENDFSNGNITYTGNKTDMAIQGDGFFILGDNNARDRLYTKAGNFQISKENQLTSKTGKYVLGWNMDPLTGDINTGATLEPIQLALGQISQPKESTFMNLKGNLDMEMPQGQMYGLQAATWDRLGVRHDIDFNFIKTSGNTFRYTAVPTDQFKPSASITAAVFRSSEAVASMLQKGDYQLQANPSATPGMVDISVVDPGGSTVFTQTITDVDQPVTLGDGTNSWFSIQYASGNAPSAASFTIGEVGDITFDALGQVQSITGSGASGGPLVSYTPDSTGQLVNIDVDMLSFTGLAADNGISVTDTDGMPASTLTNFTITDGGKVDGYYSDGSIKTIAQVATATFSNQSGLTRVGDGSFLPTPNSGIADVGLPSTGPRGQVKAQALESSNVDIADEFTEMVTIQKLFQGNSKVITIGEEILSTVINLIR
ncbi:flagellar hook protein FlgE (plasmid) [Pontibacillus sp. ALD_SL1]|uniref:flagellar hook protein FlgE n=1 Tax=Pontibacillus sp. ALD_SL1 TaxID=2777185 RepID=UPI001A97151E|nr:flagellar hook protein FlgE [Pontibacillus sp. ALD_SL1]QST03039.1 flagellar hook protein FlgE [Pontibacillus sp. ALD_SL1]